MTDTIQNHFNGILEITSDLTVAFNVSDNMVTLIPFPEQIDTITDYFQSEPELDKIGIWMFGSTEEGEKVAFLRKHKIRRGFSTYDIGAVKFCAALMLIGPKHQRNPMTTKSFDTLELYGGIIDILHPPALAFEDRIIEGCISFHKPDHYQKSFEVNVNQEKIAITYSINIGCTVKREKAPNLDDNTHSVFRMEFESSHSFDDIWKYYMYGYKLFQFCSGRQNISAEIRLYEHESNQPIRVFFKDSFDDLAQDILECVRVIQFLQLGDKLPSLFKLLNEKDSEPNLLFLPEKNRYWNKIKYTDVTDLCSSLEREYAHNGIDNRTQHDIELAKELRESIDAYIDSLESYPENIKAKAK